VRSQDALVACALALCACAPRHTARVGTGELPPHPRAVVQHSGRLWVELRGHTADRQCARPEGQRTVCFDAVHDAIGRAIAETAWPSFPAIAIKAHGDDLAPGDYLLLVSVELEPIAPDARGPGWSAAARASWKLVRDGLPVTSGEARSRSRAQFAYGRALGVAAGEVIGAVGAHIAGVLGELPESRPMQAVPLPPVTVIASGAR
jgi:hypothetical protein